MENELKDLFVSKKQFTSIEGVEVLELLKENDPRLRFESEPFEENPDIGEIHKLALQLSQTLFYNNALGLAAPQCGIMKKALALDIGQDSAKVMFNPVIVSVSNETVVMDEGCLSFPGLSVQIERPKAIRVRYKDENWNTRTDRMEGLSARIFQHEHDHLIGTTMKDRVSKLRWELSLKKRKKRI